VRKTSRIQRLYLRSRAACKNGSDKRQEIKAHSPECRKEGLACPNAGSRCLMDCLREVDEQQYESSLGCRNGVDRVEGGTLSSILFSHDINICIHAKRLTGEARPG
jgi:hypothetical protein